MDALVALPWILAAYLLGSVSFAFVVVRVLSGKDLRAVGSGNLGATNAARAIGVRGALVVYALDFGKGLGPVLVARIGLGDPEILGVVPLAIAMGAAAIAGHCWPFYLRFRGGKGVATASGAVVALAPWAMLAGVTAFGITVALSRMISLGSILGTAVLPVAFWISAGPEAHRPPAVATLLFLVALAVLVIVRHRGNIQRIVDGTEARIGRAKP